MCDLGDSCVCRLCVVFFFKQKTAYEMRISDWSSDVCSSDLHRHGPDLVEKDRPPFRRFEFSRLVAYRPGKCPFDMTKEFALQQFARDGAEIGRASWRERVCQYV